jgi:hypothetical protein
MMLSSTQLRSGVQAGQPCRSRTSRSLTTRPAVVAPQGACVLHESAAHKGCVWWSGRSLQQPAAAAAVLTERCCRLAAGAATGKKELLQYDGPLSEVDPDIAGIITNEKRRQVRTLV